MSRPLAQDRKAPTPASTTNQRQPKATPAPTKEAKRHSTATRNERNAATTAKGLCRIPGPPSEETRKAAPPWPGRAKRSLATPKTGGRQPRRAGRLKCRSRFPESTGHIPRPKARPRISRKGRGDATRRAGSANTTCSPNARRHPATRPPRRGGLTRPTTVASAAPSAGTTKKEKRSRSLTTREPTSPHDRKKDRAESNKASTRRFRTRRPDFSLAHCLAKLQLSAA